MIFKKMTSSKAIKAGKHYPIPKNREEIKMILHMYCIKDRINGFATPIPFVASTKEKAEELAKRDFAERYQTHTTVHYAPSDFSLWYVGNFDTETGTYIQKADDIKEILKGEIFDASRNSKNTV